MSHKFYLDHRETPDTAYLKISLARQTVQLIQADTVQFAAPVSTAANGPGERQGSGCTPRGWLAVRLRIGTGCPPNTVFTGRRPTGEIYSPALAAAYPRRDWILTRILWLTGLELGYNRGEAVDTLRRFIYIHGTPDSTPLGQPASKGCVRMHNRDLLPLFEQVHNGTRVLISA